MADGALELRGPADALLDEPLALSVRGSGGEEVVWRARLKDDDGRVWKAVAVRAEDLPDAWTGGDGLAALGSLRALTLDVRAEAADGRSASRAVTRRLLVDGVRVRRWREPLAGTLFLPGDRPGGDEPAAPPDAAVSAAPRALDAAVPAAPLAAVALDGAAHAAPLAAALLASRGVVVFVAASARGGEAPAVRLARATELLAAVPAATNAPGGVRVLDAPLPIPPGVPVANGDDLATRTAAWAELLERLGAR